MNLSFNDNKVLVTGADGFIGSHLCEALVKLGAKTKGLVFYNSFNKIGWLADLPENIRKDIEIIPGDIRDQNIVNEITNNVDIIFHLAALISIPYSYAAPISFLNTNTFGTLNILEGAKLNNCRRVISTSTSEVYGTALKVPINEDHRLQAQSPYSASKIAADHLLESFVRTYDIKAVTLRPFNTFGPRQSEKAVIASMIRQVIDEDVKEIKVGNLSTKRDFNYVDDTVKAFIMLAKAEEKAVDFGTAYNAGSGQTIKIEEVLEKIVALAGCKKKIVVEENRFRPKNSEVENLVACSKRFKKISNWEFDYSIDKGLEKTVDWWLRRKKKGKSGALINYSI